MHPRNPLFKSPRLPLLFYRMRLHSLLGHGHGRGRGGLGGTVGLAGMVGSGSEARWALRPCDALGAVAPRRVPAALPCESGSAPPGTAVSIAPLSARSTAHTVSMYYIHTNHRDSISHRIPSHRIVSYRIVSYLRERRLHDERTKPTHTISSEPPFVHTYHAQRTHSRARSSAPAAPTIQPSRQPKLKQNRSPRLRLGLHSASCFSLAESQSPIVEASSTHAP